MNVAVKLCDHVGNVELEIFHLSFGKILGQQTGSERPRVIEYGAPIEGTNTLVADLQHVAGFGIVDVDGPDDRVRPSSRIAEAKLGQGLDGNARLHLV